ncbi:uncharacterized protein LOC133788912 [Humulus lupulus]|uniref:uncharacterized protein LOC133788912 n=1 Tax=Humulus lupulus TaxID=3486 RepID=UPI002B40F5A4|nr:uncharacterized protein LOC133788912 [Humulus lupulus]
MEGEKRRVVIIGGGVAGSLLAKSIQFNSDLTLIDEKEYFEIPWARWRAMVEPSFGERSVINHRDYLTNGRIVASRAINITETEVLTAEGRHIPYDYLVIATGHTDPSPKTRSEMLNQYQAEYEKINSARSILIVGGGPTGVELAAEIAVDFPDKLLTLVHSGSRLLEFVGLKAAEKSLNWLTSKKVEVKLEQSVILNDDDDGDGDDIVNDGVRVFQTSGGESVKADCHFVCTGNPVASSWLKRTLLKKHLDKHGRLMVDQNLRVKNRENIFAIGDITDVPEIKQGYLAQKHALVAAKNLKLIMDGEKESRLEKYEPRRVKAIMVSLGRRDAVAQFPFTTVSGSVPGMIKSKDLFVGKTRKKLGLQPNATQID